MTNAERVLLLSPYLTSRTAEAVLLTTLGKRCEVYTRFRTEDFATGASSIRTLGRLQEHGCTLYELPSLHAKVFLVPGLFASIGSQNLTRQGTLNKEATTVFTDPRAVATVQITGRTLAGRAAANHPGDDNRCPRVALATCAPDAKGAGGV